MNSLKSIDVFAALQEDDVTRISSLCHWSKFSDHDVVIDFEDEIGNVYFVLSGRVRVTIRTEGGREIILSEIMAGDIFGELSAIDGQTRSACVMALERTEVGVMSVNNFRQSLREYPNFSFELLQILSGRLRALNTRLTEHSFLDAKHRLFNELLRLSRPRTGHGCERIVSPPPIQKELADRIGCRREVVSRELAKLTRENIVERQRGGLVIYKPDRLSQMISEAWSR